MFHLMTSFSQPLGVTGTISRVRALAAPVQSARSEHSSLKFCKRWLANADEQQLFLRELRAKNSFAPVGIRRRPDATADPPLTRCLSAPQSSARAARAALPTKPLPARGDHERISCKLVRHFCFTLMS